MSLLATSERFQKIVSYCKPLIFQPLLTSISRILTVKFLSRGLDVTADTKNSPAEETSAE